MFSLEERERVRAELLAAARLDPHVTAAAAVGGSAVGGDRWSDLDLTFAVAGGVPVSEVLSDWTHTMIERYGAAVLFDLPFLSTIYRVFLLPGLLQVDLSFTPAAEFGARGPRFELLFGEAVERQWTEPPAPSHTFGLAVHHAVRARICLERGRHWQAEYWIHALRCEVMALACGRLGLDTSHGRGFDRLPPAILTPLRDALVGDLTAETLRRALGAAVAALRREAEHVPGVVDRLRAALEELGAPAAT